MLCSYCFSPGISASYQKWRGTKEAQQTHQHYLIDQTVHNCPQHHRSVLDLRNWTGKLIIIPPSPDLWIQLLQRLFYNGFFTFYGKRWKVICGLIRQIKQAYYRNSCWNQYLFLAPHTCLAAIYSHMMANYSIGFMQFMWKDQHVVF